MFRIINEKEKAEARKCDKDGEIKNCWNFGWLDESVSISWKDKGKERTVSVKLRDSIVKINQLGKAQCQLCNDIITKSQKTAVLR